MASSSSCHKAPFIKLRRDLVEKSCGVALDMGGSTTKIVYRSTEDYLLGERKHNKKEECGVLRLAIFPRENLDDALEFIQEHCDLTSDEDGVKWLPATGLGANNYKQLIEEKLNIKVRVLAEFKCFNKALMLVLKDMPPGDAFVEHSARAKEVGEDFIETHKIFASMEGMGDRDMPSTSDEVIKGVNEHTKEDFPCLLAVCGSAFVLLTLDAEGNQHFREVSLFGGRFFLGTCGIMTGITDYKQLTEMMASSDGRTCDLYTSEVTSQDGGGTYNKLSSKDMLIFPMGKGNCKPRGEIKDADLVNSLSCNMMFHLAQLVHLTANNLNINRVLICGSVLSNEFLQAQLHANIYCRNFQAPEEKRIRTDIVNHGGYLGALGALLS